MLGCEVSRSHLHVVRREDNPNGAWAKSRRPRVVPLDFLVVQAFDAYEFERMRVPAAADSDFVLVNLFREPWGAPMRPDAVGELLAAVSRRAGLDPPVRPHQLRHACGSNLADAGSGIDVVADLLGHASVSSSAVYVNVGKRAVATLSTRACPAVRPARQPHLAPRPGTAGLRARSPGGRPGRCPLRCLRRTLHVKAGGTACPYRFRCAGCDHFRTDISYLPDLQTYLDDLLRSRERILATTDIDEWAKAEAMPSEQEITRIRRLISRITGDLDQLTDDERTQIETAVAALRRHRTTMLGMPRIRPRLTPTCPGLADPPLSTWPPRPACGSPPP